MKRAIPILLVLFFTGVPEAYCVEPTPQLKVIASQDFTDFVVVDPLLTKDLREFKKVVKRFSKDKHPTGCKILIWTNSKKAARKLPLTDAQLNSRFAVYDRNDMNGLDRLRTLKNGDVVQEL